MRFCRDEELIPLTHTFTYHEEEQAAIVSLEFVEKKRKRNYQEGNNVKLIGNEFNYAIRTVGNRYLFNQVTRLVHFPLSSLFLYDV